MSSACHFYLLLFTFIIRSPSPLVDIAYHVGTIIPNKITGMVSVILHIGIHVQ